MTDDPTPDPDPIEQTDDVAALRTEAASRRRALRAEEAKTAALTARLDASDAREVQRLAAARMANPSDLLLVTSLDDMRGEDGGIDLDKAEAAINAVLHERPHFAKPESPTPPAPEPARPDLHQGARQPAVEPPSFGRALKGER